MRCPKCPQPLTEFGTWLMCKAHGPTDVAAALPDIEPQFTAAQTRVLDRFPAILACTYATVLAPDSAATGLKNLLYAFEATLQLTVLVLASEF